MSWRNTLLTILFTQNSVDEKNALYFLQEQINGKKWRFKFKWRAAKLIATNFTYMPQVIFPQLIFGLQNLYSNFFVCMIYHSCYHHFVVAGILYNCSTNRWDKTVCNRHSLWRIHDNYYAEDSGWYRLYNRIKDFAEIFLWIFYHLLSLRETIRTRAFKF